MRCLAHILFVFVCLFCFVFVLFCFAGRRPTQGLTRTKPGLCRWATPPSPIIIISIVIGGNGSIHTTTDPGHQFLAFGLQVP